MGIIKTEIETFYQSKNKKTSKMPKKKKMMNNISLGKMNVNLRRNILSIKILENQKDLENSKYMKILFMSLSTNLNN